MKFLGSLFVCLIAFSAFGQRSSGPISVQPIHPGQGGGSGSGEGSITNLSASSATLSRSASAITVNVTNTTRLLTNVFDASFMTNMNAVTSATNGYIQITNDGVYELTMYVSYRDAVISSQLRTNVFVITTNSAGLGTNIFRQIFTTPNTNVNIYNQTFAQDQVFLASNTWVSLGMYAPVNITSTNNIAVEKAFLSAMLLPGGTMGSGSGSGSGINIGFNSTQFNTNGGILNFIADGKLTNVTVESGMIVATGNFTNNGDAYLLNGITRIQSGGSSLNLGYLSTASRTLYADSGKTVTPVSSSDPTNDLVKASGEAIPVSTNSFHDMSGLYSKNLQQNRNEFWDDFDGPTMRFGDFLQRRSPSGHTYRLHSADPQGTNGFLMTGGRIVQTNHLDTPFYLSVSNTVPSFVKPWNRFGAVIVWKSNAPPTTFLGEFGLINISHAILGAHSGDYLHTYMDINGTPVMQRSLTENIISEDNGLGVLGAGTYHNGGRVIYEINVFSNSVTYQIGGWIGTRYYTNFAAFTRWPVVMWELFGSGTNEVQPEIESIWAGYADPALEILANSPRKLGTNYSEITEITAGTLTAGTYTNKEADTIVALGAGSTRTNKLFHHTNTFGKSITIVDVNQTATGTNIIVETMDNSLIYPGASVRTNISENGGSIELLRATNGWNVVNRPTLPPPGGVGSPGGTDASIQVNYNGEFYGTNGTSQSFIFDRTNSWIGLNLGGRFPIHGIEIGDSGPGGVLDEAEITIGQTTVTNTMNVSGMSINNAAGNASFTINTDGMDLQIGVGGANVMGFGAAFPIVGEPSRPAIYHTLLDSNSVQNAFSVSSTVTIYPTNQNWVINGSSNFTFAVGDLYSNVFYRVDGTNNSVITWPLTIKWVDGVTTTSAPAFTNTAYGFEVWKSIEGTNARVLYEKNLALTAGQNTTITTNESAGTLTVASTSLLTNLSNIKFAVNRISTLTFSNLVLSFNTNSYEVIGQTNMVFTNVLAIADLVDASAKVYIRPSGINMTLVYPPFNTATNGYFWKTNINSPMWTTATNGVTYVLSLTALGTNIFSTLTPW